MVGDINLFFGDESDGAGEINMMIAGSEQTNIYTLLDVCIGEFNECDGQVL